MTFRVISSFDWLNDVTVTSQQWWRDITKFEQNCHKFYVFNANFDGFKAGNYCMINRIPCSCLLIWNLTDLTRKRGMALQSLAIHTRFLVATDKLHIKRHEHGILYLRVSTTDRWKTLERPCGDCTDIVRSPQPCIEIVRHPCGCRKCSARTCAVAVREPYDPLAIFIPKKTI